MYGWMALKNELKVAETIPRLHSSEPPTEPHRALGKVDQPQSIPPFFKKDTHSLVFLHLSGKCLTHQPPVRKEMLPRVIHPRAVPNHLKYQRPKLFRVETKEGFWLLLRQLNIQQSSKSQLARPRWFHTTCTSSLLPFVCI